MRPQAEHLEWSNGHPVAYARTPGLDIHAVFLEGGPSSLLFHVQLENTSAHPLDVDASRLQLAGAAMDGLQVKALDPEPELVELEKQIASLETSDQEESNQLREDQLPAQEHSSSG